jgi:hypothetical protein
MWEIDHMII